MPILFGPSRGMRWIAGSGPHSNWLGINEINKRKRFVELVGDGAVVYDIGANVGSYSMLASRVVGRSGRVIAIEPLPANLEFLERHIRLNGLSNVRVVPVALNDRIGKVRFRGTTDRVTSHIAEDGDFDVECTTLDHLVEEAEAARPHCLKIDVEGAEVGVLRGATRTLRELRPVVFLATHGREVREQSLALLANAAYLVESIPGLEEEFIALPRPG